MKVRPVFGRHGRRWSTRSSCPRAPSPGDLVPDVAQAAASSARASRNSANSGTGRPVAPFASPPTETVPEPVASGGAPEPAEDGADEHAQDSAAATRYHAEARWQPLSRKDPL